MNQPWDLKALEAKLIVGGLPAVEGLAKMAIDCVFAWTEESITLTPSKIDDLALIVLPKLKEYINAKVDAISAPVAPPAA